MSSAKSALLSILSLSPSFSSAVLSVFPIMCSWGSVVPHWSQISHLQPHTHTHTEAVLLGGGGEDALKAWLVSSSSSSSSPFVSVFSFHLRAPAPGATYWAGDRPAAILPVLTCVCLSVFVIWVLFEAFKWGCGSWGWVRQWYKATVARKCLCGCGSTLQPKRFSS